MPLTYVSPFQMILNKDWHKTETKILMLPSKGLIKIEIWSSKIIDSKHQGFWWLEHLTLKKYKFYTGSLQYVKE